MKLNKLTATFGRLDRAELVPGAGLTLIEAPNEGGKSTWCAFLRAMFYGFPARDRDKVGYIAEKTRYQPWSGAPMEGSIDLTWQGRELTLYRGPKGSVPWGAFSAVWTITREPVGFLTAENCGETLLGVSREVFERTAFVGQGNAALSPSGDLEKRVAALATSGEEEVSFSQVERRLKDWLNRRRSNSRNGLIPKLEAELEEVVDAQSRQAGLLRRAQAAQQEKEALERQKTHLEEQLRALSDARQAQQAQRRRQAQADADSARAAWEEARRTADGLPSADELRQAQGDLSYTNTLTASLRQAEKSIPSAREAAERAQSAAAADPYFGGLDPAQAAARAQADHDEAVRLTKKGATPLSLLGAPAGAVLGTVLWRGLQGAFDPISIPFLLLGAILGWALIALPMALLSSRRRKRAQVLLDRYQVQVAQDILDLSAAYGEKTAAAQEARRQVRAVEEERDRLSAQKLELTGRLLHLVHPFAPEVTDLFGVSAALSRALQQGERCRLAEVRLAAAEQLLSALPAVEIPACVPASLPDADAADLAAQLTAVTGELNRISDDAARFRGELNSLGDPTELEARRGILTEELDHRRGEFDALTAALDSLHQADSLLRERFSPAVNQRAGEYLAALTGGKYDRAALTRQFQALAQETGATAPRQDLVLSGGTAQQLYLAVRLAMCDLALSGDEPCPILLDDALDAFDDERANLALDCLLSEAKTRQILLFSCHSREAARLRGRGDTAVVST
ncbi:MAG: AAA family ATPase [Pseudoflavonifractor sp.]|nr:AAA family ATPase [Pseudoflavonifractor sp.]